MASSCSCMDDITSNIKHTAHELLVYGGKWESEKLTYNLDGVPPDKIWIIWTMIGTQTLHQGIVQVRCGNSSEIGEVTVVPLFFEPSSEGPTSICSTAIVVCNSVWHWAADWRVSCPPIGITMVLKVIVLNCAAKPDTFPCTDRPGGCKWSAITEAKCQEGREQPHCSLTIL